jgi:hypothetical protein
LEPRAGQRRGIDNIAVCADLNLMALACSNHCNTSVDLCGLERVHDNELPYKYSFGPGCEVEAVFSGISDMAFGPTSNLLFVADFGCARIRVLDVGRRIVGMDLRCSGEPRFLACARDMLAMVLVGHDGLHFIEIRQYSSACPVLRTLDLDLRIVSPYGLGFSTDGTTLAVAADSQIFFISAPSGTVSKIKILRHPFVRNIFHSENHGWLVSADTHVRSLNDPVLVEPERKHRIFLTAILPRFGMAKVEMDRYGSEFVYLVA